MEFCRNLDNYFALIYCIDDHTEESEAFNGSIPRIPEECKAIYNNPGSLWWA